MSTDLSFTSDAGDYRQLRFNGSTSIIPLLGADSAGTGTPSAANTAQAVFAHGFATDGYGFPFRGVPANLTLQDAPPGAYQLRFNGTVSILPFAGMAAPAAGNPSATNAAWGVWVTGFDTLQVGAPFRGVPANLTLDRPVPSTTALTFGGAAQLLPVPAVDDSACGIPAVNNAATGLFMSGFSAFSYGSIFCGVPTNLALQDAPPVGPAYDLYFNYGSALRPVGAASAGYGVPDVQNAGRAVWFAGFDSLQVGGWAEGWRKLTMPSVGEVLAFGTAKADTWWKFVTPRLGDAAGYGTPVVYGTTVTLSGFDSLRIGTGVIKLQSVFPAGADSAAYGQDTVYNFLSVVTHPGWHSLVVGALDVEYGARAFVVPGFDALGMTDGRPIVDNIGTRSVTLSQTPLADGYGAAYVGNYTRYLSFSGMQPPPLGNAEIDLYNRYVYPAGPVLSAYGTPQMVQHTRYLEVGPANSGEAITPASITRKIRELYPAGTVETLYGAATVLLRNREVFPVSDDYAAFSFATVQNMQRQVKPAGEDMLRTDKAEAINRNRSVPLAGTSMAGTGTPAASNLSQGVFLSGGTETGYGQAWVDRAQRPVQVIGIDPMGFGQQWVDRGARPGQMTGFTATTYGVPSLSNVTQIVNHPGLTSTGYGVPLVRDTNDTATVQGTAMAAVGALAVRYGSVGPAGFDQLQIGTPSVSRAVRTVTVRPADDIGMFGQFDIHNLNVTLTMTGAPPPAWYGDLLVRDRTFKVYPPGTDMNAMGVSEGVGPRWVTMASALDTSGPGTPHAGISYGGQVQAQGVAPRNRYGLAYIYNNARLVYPAEYDAAVLPRIADVSGPIKQVTVPSIVKDYASDYTVVYNAARALYPVGADMAGYGAGLDTLNANRTYKPPSIQPGEVGIPWASFARRYVQHEDRSSTPTIALPLVQLWRREIRPAGLSSFGDALAFVFEHFNLVKPVPVLPPVTPQPTVYNNTPEVHTNAPAPAEAGVPLVYSLKRYLPLPEGVDSAVVPKAAVSWRDRRVYPVGESMRVLGNPTVQEDLLNYPITRTVFMNEYEFRPPQFVGAPSIRSNYVYMWGLASSTRFGDFVTQEQSITFDGSSTTGAWDLEMLRVPAPRVVMAFTQYAYVAQDTGTSPDQWPRRHHVSPDYVFTARPRPETVSRFWETPTETADNSAFGDMLVESSIRTRTMTGTAMSYTGLPLVYENGPQRLYMQGPDPLYFGWLEASGGVRWVDTFDGAGPLDFVAVPRFTVTRPVEPPSPNVYPAGLHSLQVGANTIDTFHRQRVVGGTDMLRADRFVVTPPFFVTPVDTDLAKYGMAYADHSIRTIIHIGEDMFVAEPDYSGADETTVSTPTPPAPAQYVYVKGRKPPECCWGFYIGRGA